MDKKCLYEFRSEFSQKNQPPNENYMLGALWFDWSTNTLRYNNGEEWLPLPGEEKNILKKARDMGGWGFDG